MIKDEPYFCVDCYLRCCTMYCVLGGGKVLFNGEKILPDSVRYTFVTYMYEQVVFKLFLSLKLSNHRILPNTVYYLSC